MILLFMLEKGNTKRGAKVLYVTSEGTEDELQDKIDRCWTRADQLKLENAGLSEEEISKYNKVAESVIAKGTYNLMHIDDVLSQIESNDIIEYQILADDRAILIGASSDNRYGSDKFFDKKYYCDKQEFDTIDELSNALSKYLFDDCLQVMAIDGIKVK